MKENSHSFNNERKLNQLKTTESSEVSKILVQFVAHDYVKKINK